MNTVVLIAYGPNNIEIPCRLFEDLETGKQICNEIFGMEGELLKHEDKDVIRYRKDLDDEDEGNIISEQLFTSFYYGCGGPYTFVLREVDFNTKFVPFELD